MVDFSVLLGNPTPIIRKMLKNIICADGAKLRSTKWLKNLKLSATRTSLMSAAF